MNMKNEAKTNEGEQRIHGPIRRSPVRRSTSRKILLLAGALFAGVLIAELSLRALGVAHPRISQRDEYRGTVLRPGVQWWFTDEGHAHIKINDDGFRDRNRSLKKPPETVRIAVLGDSYVAAWQVPMEQRLTEVLERELNGQKPFGAKRVEVLNFGVPGYGTAQELMTLRHVVWKYEPDIVVLAFLTGNDLRNNSKKLQNDDGRPYFYLRDGELVFDDSFRTSPGHVKTWWENAAYAAMDYSCVLQVCYDARKTFIKRRSSQQARAAANDVPDELGLDTLIYREPADDVWEDTWRVTEALLTLMSHEVEAHNARFLVVTLSNGIQAHPDASVRRQMMETLGVDTLFYPDRRLKAAGQREGFDVINLAPRFQTYAEEHNAYLHGFENTKLGEGHWNERGHRLAGELLAEEIGRRWTIADKDGRSGVDGDKVE